MSPAAQPNDRGYRGQATKRRGDELQRAGFGLSGQGFSAALLSHRSHSSSVSDARKECGYVSGRLHTVAEPLVAIAGSVADDGGPVGALFRSGSRSHPEVEILAVDPGFRRTLVVDKPPRVSLAVITCIWASSSLHLITWA